MGRVASEFYILRANKSTYRDLGWIKGATDQKFTYKDIYLVLFNITKKLEMASTFDKE